MKPGLACLLERLGAGRSRAIPHGALLALLLITFVPPGRADEQTSVFNAVCPEHGWYPSDRTTLAAMVDGFIDKAPKPQPDGSLFGIIAPHAGYQYSGPVAGYSYQAVKGGAFERIVVLGPFHGLFNRFLSQRDYAAVSVLDADTYQTPLGGAAIDREAAARIIASDPRITSSRGMFLEHSVDSQIPFIQRALPGIPIVPIIIGKATLDTAEWLAPLLIEHLSDKRTLFIASSDLSHFHAYDEGNRRDARTLESIRSLDLNGIETGIDGSDLCGRGAVLTLLKVFTLSGGGQAVVLDHRNSGDTSGDKRRVVGYAAVALVSKPGPPEGEARDQGSPRMRPEVRRKGKP